MTKADEIIDWKTTLKKTTTAAFADVNRVSIFPEKNIEKALKNGCVLVHFFFFAFFFALYEIF